MRKIKQMLADEAATTFRSHSNRELSLEQNSNPLSRTSHRGSCPVTIYFWALGASSHHQQTLVVAPCNFCAPCSNTRDSCAAPSF